MAIEVDLLSEIQELNQVSNHWDRLESALSTPIQHYIWSKTWIEICAGNSRLSIIVMKKDGTPAAIAPLYLPKGIFSAFEQVGVKDLPEPADFVYAEISDLQHLMDELAKRKMPLLLRRLPQDSFVLETIRKSFHKRGLVICRPRDRFPYIELGSGWENPETKLPRRLVGDLRRARRKAEQLGIVSFEIHSPSTASEFVALYEEAVQIEATGWKGRANSALERNPFQNRFYKEYGLKACEKGIQRVCFMRINGQVVAMQLAIESNGGFWLLKIGYDEGFSRCSPGQLLMLETIRYAGEQGLLSYEFLGSASSWTRRWTTSERASLAVHVYPYSLKGLMILFCGVGRYLRTYLFNKIHA